MWFMAWPSTGTTNLYTGQIPHSNEWKSPVWTGREDDLSSSTTTPPIMFSWEMWHFIQGKGERGETSRDGWYVLFYMLQLRQQEWLAGRCCHRGWLAGVVFVALHLLELH